MTRQQWSWLCTLVACLCCLSMQHQACAFLVLPSSSSAVRPHNERISFVLLASAQHDEEQAMPIPSPPNPSTRRRRGPIRRVQPTATQRAEAVRVETTRLRQEISQRDETLLSPTMAFCNVSSLAPGTQRALTEMLGPRQPMTRIQAQTYDAIRSGDSVLARARTGSGKTLAFLVPAVENLLDRTTDAGNPYLPGQSIGMIVLAPTRELALQIAETAQQLVAHHPALSVQAVYGGTKIPPQLRQLDRRLPSILVATPGRLGDLLDERLPSRAGRIPVKRLLADARMLVLDEADALLAPGLASAVVPLLDAMPPPHRRQTLLFSATAAFGRSGGPLEDGGEGRQRILVAGRDAIFPVNYTVADGVARDSKLLLEERQQRGRDAGDLASTEKNKSDPAPRVEETFVVLPNIELYVPALLSLLRDAAAQEQGTTIVFLPTAKLVKFVAALAPRLDPALRVVEMHSRMSQAARERASAQFRQDRRNVVLLSSDVTARGMDYPHVHRVVQYGLPRQRHLYVHRLGRAGRAGRAGCGLLVAMPFEKSKVATLAAGRGGRSEHRRNLLSNDGWARQLGALSAEEENAATCAEVQRLGWMRELAEAAVRSFVAHYLEGGYIRQTAEILAKSVGLTNLPDMPALEDKLR